MLCGRRLTGGASARRRHCAEGPGGRIPGCPYVWNTLGPRDRWIPVYLQYKNPLPGPVASRYYELTQAENIDRPDRDAELAAATGRSTEPEITAVCVSIDRLLQDRGPNACLPFDGIGARYPRHGRYPASIASDLVKPTPSLHSALPRNPTGG